MGDYSLDDLKLIYRVLHRNLSQNVALLDSQFFEDLQRHLQQQAQAENVDVADHGAWDAWLGKEASGCSLDN